MRPLTRAAVTGLIVLAAAIAGCKESKVTQSNLDQIRPGMTLRDVELILGKGEVQDAPEGTSISGAGIGTGGTRGTPPKVVVWKEKRSRIAITFINDKVADKMGESLPP